MFRHLALPHPIFVVFNENQRRKAETKARSHRHLPVDPGRLTAELNEMVAGVPLVVDEPYTAGADRSLRLFGTTFVTRLFELRRRTGYYLGQIDPPRLRSNDDLLRGCLLVRPAAWYVVGAPHDIPDRQTNGWGTLLGAWNTITTGPRKAAPNPGHLAFLDTVEQLVEADHRITSDAQRSTPPFPYRRFDATGGQRRAAHSAYVFRVAGRQRPAPGDYVQIRGLPESRGKVTSVDDDRVTVAFGQPIDLLALPQVGELEIAPLDIAYRAQKDAVQLIRRGQARGASLLPALVDRRVAPIRPRDDEPTEPLNRRQLDAFRLGLGVEDVLVVLGPPGTGKTRTISQLARAAAQESPAPVLVTAQSNRAVDNVLSKLSAALVVVRVGGDGVTDEGAPYLLERQASDLRREILGQTATHLDAYRGLERASKWTRELDGALTRLAASDAEVALRHDGLIAAQRAVGGAGWSQVDTLDAERRRLDRRGERLRRRVERLHRWRTGPFARLIAVFVAQRLAAAEAAGTALAAAARANDAERADAMREIDVATRDIPAVRAARTALDAAVRQQNSHRDDARAAADAALACLPAGARISSGLALTDVRDRLAATLPLLVARQRLLTDWHAEVSGATDQLYPELIRYAHVVAATCTGAASRPELAGVEFDLAIVDEAGQVNLANALVPLVRSRRAVLVGDHWQLPPFLDTEVEAWGNEVGDPLIRRLLAKSALELLVDALGERNVVQLVEQRRMPPVIASFISERFYQGQLETVYDRAHQGPLFETPFVFVDTSELPVSVRNEQSAGGPGEAAGQSGSTNPLEAGLLRDLALYYERHGHEWAIIVPYQAQRTALVAALAPRVGREAAELNVGTVDSFQGGERDVILWGATRSNPSGRVGFLRELRRSNVAFSRAKYQLVLVGDLTTLTGATDTGFRELVLALVGHLRASGGIRTYRDVVDMLAASGAEGGVA